MFLENNESVKVYISCHSDTRGEVLYNKELSENRGKNIKLYLQNHGIKDERLIIEAYGESNPLFNCEVIKCDDDQHAKNRRAELKIIWN